MYVWRLGEVQPWALQEEGAGPYGRHQIVEMVWNFSGPFFGEELGDVGGGLMVCGLPRGMSTECRGISWKSHILVLEGEAGEPQHLSGVWVCCGGHCHKYVNLLVTWCLCLSVPLNIRKTLSGRQGRQVCLAAGIQVAQQHLGVASKEVFGSDLRRTRAGPHLSVERDWIPV